MKRDYTAPHANGLSVYEWNTDCVAPVICHLAYIKARPGSFEPGGGQIEPDQPESMELGAAYVLDVDIYYLLGLAQVTEIEEAALRQLHDEKQNGNW